jgi:deoxyribodipyrimidine photolyase-related protein
MRENEWSVYHSRLSFLMNSKILSPKEVIERVEEAWREDKKKYPISAVEGFIRQILGWREFMRGVYWAKMPGYARSNYFRHQRKLPKWYWTGETKMNCLSQAINQSLDYAYAHHIQRLMITGNFALLAGIHPDEVDAWYLGVYIDAIEWVEITNTRGMSQFADGGIVGTKPYVSSANYVDKMSDYCKNCHYSKSKKTGDKACPFNSFFWNFYEQHRDKLENNPRIGFVYQTLGKMKREKKEELFKQADYYLKNLDEL